MAIDRILTDYGDRDSYLAIGTLNGRADFRFDLRAFGQRFAYYYGECEPDLVEALAMLYRGGTFVDVGSSIGLYLVCLGPLLRAHGARAVSFEPVPANLERQRENLALNGLADLVEMFPCALGDVPGEMPMAVDDTGADNNAFFSRAGLLRVPVRTLDETLGGRGDLRPLGMIKMDVEGYESHVITGGRGIIAADRPIILAEFNRERMAINGLAIHEPWNFLLGAGYEAFVLRGRRLAPLAQPGDEENLFFLPRGRAGEPWAW